MSYALNRW